jgi:hypothetical protein
MEFLKNLWNGKSELKDNFPADLKELITQRQNLKKSIKGLEIDMKLTASDRDQRHSLDETKRKEYAGNDKILAKRIFNLCLKYNIEPIRFLSPEEISEFSPESNNEEKTT